MGIRYLVGPVLGGALALASISGAPFVLGPAKVTATHAEKPQAETKRRRAPTRPVRGPALPAPIRGQLADGDGVLQTGEFVDRHTVTLPPGQAVRLFLSSTAVDPYLIVRSPSGQQSDNDDIDGSTRNAAVVIPSAERGQYTILVTTYQRGETGAYELRFEPASSTTVVPPPDTPATPDRPHIGMPTVVPQPTGPTENGTLAQGDRTLQSGEFYDTITRSFTRGQPVRIRMESTAIDTYLIVRSPSGHQFDNDDTTPSDRNATVDIPAAEAGNYTITLTSYAAGETGPYTVSFSSGLPNNAQAQVVVPNNAVNPNNPNNGTGRASGTSGEGGRIFGIYAGISDYPGSGDLPECAEDAIKLAQAMRRAGLQTEQQQIVLTDGQATTGNIRNAMARMAQDVGPNDVFVFFYSGHGSQRAGSRDVREIDQIDETIHVYDGDIVDDEFGTMLDGFRTNLAVVTLDSCFSGGFAKDVITRPGRVGFFSSQEDVESAVATQFQAGGYLSYFLREGASGEADTNPHDSVLTVGELEHYLVNQFGQNARDIAMDGAFQHLVTDRGAVRGQQVLFRYH